MIERSRFLFALVALLMFELCLGSTGKADVVGCGAFYHLDVGSQTTVARAIALADSAWSPLRSASSGYGFSQSTLWLKLICENQSDIEKQYIAEIRYALLDRVEVYKSDSNRYQLIAVLGDLQDVNGNIENHRNPAFPITLMPGQKRIFLLKINTLGSLQAPLAIVDRSTFDSRVRLEYLLIGTYYGILVAVLLYNLFLYITSRDRNFLIYCIFVSSFGVFQLSANGLFHSIFSIFWIQNQGLSLVMVFTQAMILLFSSNFLASSGSRALSVLFLQKLGFLLVPLSIATIFIPYQYTSPASAALAIVIPVLVLAVSFRESSRGHAAPRIFMLAWFTYLMGTLILAAKNLGYVAPNGFTNNAIQVGSAMEMILLSISLGMRWREFEAQKMLLEDKFKVSEVMAHAAQMLSHDMRAPLGVFERLLHIAPEAFPSMREAISESLNRLHHMIESFRHANLDALIKRVPSHINIESGLAGLVGKAHELNIQILTSRMEVGRVLIDPMKFERAWVNLMANAIEAAHSMVSLEVKKSNRDLFLTIYDDGPGVSKDLLPKLFERGATHGKDSGTGLGLAYVRQIMRGHGGDVTYRRENGLTIFECRLPNAVVPVEENSMKNQIIGSSSDKARRKKLVAFRFKPESLNRSIIAVLCSQKSENFQFSCEYEIADVVATNDPDIALDAIEEGREPLEFSSNLQEAAIVDRLIRRFHLV